MQNRIQQRQEGINRTEGKSERIRQMTEDQGSKQLVCIHCGQPLAAIGWQIDGIPGVFCGGCALDIANKPINDLMVFVIEVGDNADR